MLTAISQYFDSTLVSRIEAILARPEAKAIANAERLKQHEQRVADVAERDRLQQALEAVHVKWSPKLATAEQQVERTKRAFDASLAALADCRASFRQEHFAADRRHTDAATAVYQSSPGGPFFLFRERVNAALLDTQRQADEVRELCVDGLYRVTWNNRASVLRRLDAISASLHEADELRHEALTPEELEQRFDAIAATWPAVEPRPAHFLRRDDADA